MENIVQIDQSYVNPVLPNFDVVNAYFEFKMVNDEKVKEKALDMLLDHALANSP